MAREDGERAPEDRVRVVGLYLDGAGAAVDGRGEPGHHSVAVHQHVDIQGHVELAVVTAG